MPGFNTLPAVGGGGGQANMTYVASIHMSSYNRSWAQGGTAGYYALYSTNQENGYAYFVGSGTTTGIALNRLANISHSFTRIDIIAPTNDMVSLYKAKVKSTTEFPNPFAAFSSFPSIIQSSGNFVLPNNALPLVNLVLVGGGGSGGHGSHNWSGGGGGGGNVVKLTAYQAVGTTAVTCGAGANDENGGRGGTTYFGNVWAIGGGSGGHGQNHPGGSGGNGGGAGQGSQAGGSGIAATNAAGGVGFGTAGSPLAYGGFAGGNAEGGGAHHHRSGGGGGAAARGLNANEGPNGGAGHISDIVSGTANHMFGPGAAGGNHGSGRYTNGWNGYSRIGYGGQAGLDGNGGREAGGVGSVVVRYYIP